MDNIKIIDSFVKELIEEKKSKYICLSNFFDFNLIFKTNYNYSITLFNIMEVILSKPLVRVERIEGFLSILISDSEYFLFDYSENVIE